MASQSLTLAQITSFGFFRILGISALSTSVSELINFPNPFNPIADGETKLRYSLGEDSDVTLVIYDLLGNLVWKEEIPRGSGGAHASPPANVYPWRGRNGQGDIVANGGYIAQLIITNSRGTMKVKRKVAVLK